MKLRVRPSSDSPPAASWCCWDGVRGGDHEAVTDIHTELIPRAAASCVGIEPSPQTLGHDPAIGADLELRSGHGPAAHADIHQPVTLPDGVDTSGTLGNLIVGPVPEAVTWPCLQLLHRAPSKLLPTRQLVTKGYPRSAGSPKSSPSQCHVRLSLAQTAASAGEGLPGQPRRPRAGQRAHSADARRGRGPSPAAPCGDPARRRSP